jgi:hypothetical protein
MSNKITIERRETINSNFNGPQNGIFPNASTVRALPHPANKFEMI